MKARGTNDKKSKLKPRNEGNESGTIYKLREM